MKKIQETIRKITKNVLAIFCSLFFLGIFTCFVFCFHITGVKAEEKIVQVQNKDSKSSKVDTRTQHVEKYIFVSTSMPKKNLIQLAMYAKEHNAGLILRGLIDGSYKKTVAVLEIITKTGQGFSIDPELFTRYDVKIVPTFVLGTRRPKDSVFDKISGNVTPNYAFDMLMRKGEVMR